MRKKEEEFKRYDIESRAKKSKHDLQYSVPDWGSGETMREHIKAMEAYSDGRDDIKCPSKYEVLSNEVLARYLTNESQIRDREIKEEEPATPYSNVTRSPTPMYANVVHKAIPVYTDEMVEMIRKQREKMAREARHGKKLNLDQLTGEVEDV